MKPFPRRALLLAAAAAGLAGCAHPPRVAPPDLPHWSGRLALAVTSEPPQSFSAGFELTGDAREGELLLFSPLGSTLATLRWTPSGAVLRSGSEERSYDSLNALASEVTGTPIPVRALFDWLAGTPLAADGWQPDLSRLAEGRLLARRDTPSPSAELRLLLDR